VNRAIALLTLIAALFCGVGAPAMAGALDLGAACAIADRHCDAVSTSDAGHAPADAQLTHHHHCIHAIEPRAFAVAPVVEARDAPALPVRAAALASRSQAPPTEPPAA
jgi:hypothetical protein